MAVPRRSKKTTTTEEVADLSAAAVTDPFDDFVDPTSEAGHSPLSEQETMPEYFTYFASSRVVSAAYDRESRRLYMRFVKPVNEGGTPWTYEDVPPNVWRNLLRSKSPGRFVDRNLAKAGGIHRYPNHRGEWSEYG